MNRSTENYRAAIVRAAYHAAREEGTLRAGCCLHLAHHAARRLLSSRYGRLSVRPPRDLFYVPPALLFLETFFRARPNIHLTNVLPPIQ
jgi:hypothetical protein